MAGKRILRSPCTDSVPVSSKAALPFRGDAFRVVYAVQLADEIWVIHAFQKKSKQGIKTPKHEIELVKDRLKRLKEALR
jgi:phage-related protein